MKLRGLVPLAVASCLLAARAGAQQPAPAATVPPAEVAPPSILAEAPPEAPPPPPRHKGLVLETGLGALGFLGKFQHVAPTAPWAYGQLGYEPLGWLMVFGYGELAFTDTSVAEDESHARAFPMFGFGGGLRATVHASDRVAVFAQGAIGAMKADVPHGALEVLGYLNAESLAAAFGARLGVEWYQIDRHLALALEGGIREATGFQKTFGSSDTPLMFDGDLAFRYTF